MDEIQIDDIAQEVTIPAVSVADEALGDLDKSELFSSGKVRVQIAREKAKISGKTVSKHRNGKVDLGSVVDDPKTSLFVCPYCSKSFSHKHVFDRHVSQTHEQHTLVLLKCPHCSYSTRRKDQLKAHYLTVHDDFKPYRCSECDFRTSKSFRVTAHIMKHHGGGGTVLHDPSSKPRNIISSPLSKELRLRVGQDGEMIQPEKTKTFNSIKNLLPTQPLAKSSLPGVRQQHVIVSRPDPAPVPEPEVEPPKDKEMEEKEWKHTFYCPHCDFESEDQLLMGNHVVTNHTKEHSARNAQPPVKQECSLCYRKLDTEYQLQDHVRAEHPDVVVV